jgi:hypothetical protein
MSTRFVIFKNYTFLKNCYEINILPIADKTLDNSLFYTNVPVELRQIILEYYDLTIGFAEAELYFQVLQKSRFIRLAADLLYNYKQKHSKTYKTSHYFDYDLFNYHYFDLNDMFVYKETKNKTLQGIMFSPYLLLYAWEKFNQQKNKECFIEDDLTPPGDN